MIASHDCVVVTKVFCEYIIFMEPIHDGKNKVKKSMEWKGRREMGDRERR